MIGTPLGALTFLNPWLLGGLLFLPLLWFLLRVTPPAPRRIYFPAARFLGGLQPDDHTVSHTPWWILLLRLTAVALLILALARPLLNPGDALPGASAIRIVMDNGWAAGQSWTMQKEEAAQILEQAKRENRTLYILTTAPEPGQKKPAQHGPLTAAQAEPILRGLMPRPWPSDYEQTAHVAKEQNARKSIYSFFLSSGFEEKGFKDLLKALQGHGGARVTVSENLSLPLILRSQTSAGTDLGVRVSAPVPPDTDRPVTVRAMAADGRVIDAQSEILPKGEKGLDITFDIPAGAQGQVARIDMSGLNSAGTVLTLDNSFIRRTIGIAAPSGNDADTAPLAEARFYLERALEPYADMHFSPAPDLIRQKPSLIVLPDIGAMPPGELSTLETWVKDGGILLRFAGPNMTGGDNFLTPVRLRKGGRAMDGAMTWEKPAKLAPFPENSPFYDLDVPAEDITVRRQMLAEPSDDLADKSWALLTDGTPLITAASLGSGLLILIHTTADPSWSDLALSGLYVRILRRILTLSPSSTGKAGTTGTLTPLTVLDGFGTLHQPDSTVKPIASKIFDEIVPDSEHPPGLYGRTGYKAALNLGDRLDLTQLDAISSLPIGVDQQTYRKIHNETDLMSSLMLAAFLLFLLDWLLMLGLQTGSRLLHPRDFQAFMRMGTSAIFALFVFFASPSAHAMTEEEKITYAAELHLAYITSPSADINRTARRGLETLKSVLTKRTSVEPAGVVALNLETDELSLFPVIYWPITPDYPDLSDKALLNVQGYLDHGGTILIDTQDQYAMPRGTVSYSATRQAESLRRVIGMLDIPPLTPIPEDHVLTKSFYLLKTMPGHYEGGTIWVEQQSADNRDGVSSVIIGGHDWASAWAKSYNGQKMRIIGGTRQEELALRFGVNLVMYALTGNYKADQVHLPHILERLGQ